MTAQAQSVLYVRLPCWKIYPGGVIYVADYLHKQRPEVCQHMLDLALVPSAARRRSLLESLAQCKPDIVAFSWRNMQSFGPHPEDDALAVVMNFDHSPKGGARRAPQRMRCVSSVTTPPVVCRTSVI
jgi:hypothetical protein